MFGEFTTGVSKPEPWDEASRFLIEQEILVLAESGARNTELQGYFDEALIHGWDEAAIVYALTRYLMARMFQKVNGV